MKRYIIYVKHGAPLLATESCTYIIHTFSRCIFTMLTCKSWCMLKCSHFKMASSLKLGNLRPFCPPNASTALDAQKTRRSLGCWANTGRREWGASTCFGHPPACLGLGLGVGGPSCSVKNGTKICVFGSKTPLQLDLKYSPGKWTRECSIVHVSDSWEDQTEWYIEKCQSSHIITHSSGIIADLQIPWNKGSLEHAPKFKTN